VRHKQHGPACASTLTEPRSGDSKQGQDDTEHSEVSACYLAKLISNLFRIEWGYHFFLWVTDISAAEYKSAVSSKQARPIGCGLQL